MRKIRLTHITPKQNNKIKPFFIVSFKGDILTQSAIDELDILYADMEEVLKGKSKIIMYDSSNIDIKFIEPEAVKNKKIRRVRL